MPNQHWEEIKKLLSEIKNFEFSVKPAITEPEITEFKEQTELDIPPELLEVYKVNNGEEQDVFFGMLYGSRVFSSQEAAEQWQEFADMAEDFEDDEMEFDPKMIRGYPCPQVIPFLTDGNGNCLGIDTKPSSKGQLGQIVEYGADLESAKVVANSLSDLLSQLKQQIQDKNYTVIEEDGCLAIEAKDKSKLPSEEIFY